MAFTSTLLKKVPMPGGFVRELYSWDGASVTTGSITADATIQPEISEILGWGASSDADTADLVVATDTGENIIKLTFASGDSGRLWIDGLGK